MAEAVSPTRKSAGEGPNFESFYSRSLPQAVGHETQDKRLFDRNSRSFHECRKDDESSNHFLPKDRRVRAMTMFTDAVQTFNADLDKYDKPSLEHQSSTESNESLDFNGDIEIVLKRVLSQLSEYNKTYAEPKLVQHINFVKLKLKNKEVTIGVFGRIKAGKSTLLNALTHSRLFPTDSSNPETSVVVGLTHKDDIHIGACTDECQGRRKNCPQLQDKKRTVLAQGSEEIIEFLEDNNKNARRHGDEQRYLLIKAHVPALKRCWFKDKQVVIQDTPGLGEADNTQVKEVTENSFQVVIQDTPGLGEADNKQIKEVTENSFHSCCAFLYVVDCSKLSDHLDVTTLNIIKQKDRKIFEDGRLLTLANHFDRTFQVQAKSKKFLSDPIKIKKDVGEMTIQGVDQVTLTKYIVPCIAYWAWCTRVSEDMDEDDFEFWKKKYLSKVQLPPGFKCIEGSQKFIEDVSGVKVVENWLTTIAENGRSLFIRSAISDVMYCVGLCIESCVTFGETVINQAQEMGCVMASKADTWNEAVGILTYIENEIENLRDVIGYAYDEDVQSPVTYLENTALQQIEAFREKCCGKCSQYASNTEDEEDDSDDEDEWFGTGEVAIQSMDAYNSLDVQEILELQDQSTDVVDDDNDDPNAYRLNEFRDDLKTFAQELENQLNRFLATVRFDRIPQVIPLQEFRDNKATLDLCAFVFLTGKPSQNQTECQRNKKKYTPSSEEIEAIFMQRPLTMNQLRERASINQLKLSWITRMRIWFQRKFGKTLVKNNYIMTRKDVNSAIRFLMKNQCLEECSNFLRVGVKQQIVECYYNEYSTYVKNTLDDYEKTSLSQMEENSKKMENEMSTLLETHRHNMQRHADLVKYMSNLEWEKNNYMLNMEEFKDTESSQ